MGGGGGRGQNVNNADVRKDSLITVQNRIIQGLSSTAGANLAY